MKIKNIAAALKDQMPVRRFIRNMMKGHLIGLFSKRSHLRADGTAKVTYNSKKSTEKAAASMMKKYGTYYSNYKCVHCDGFHIGKNSENKPKNEEKNSN